MSQADEFRRYADEALRDAAQAKTEQEKQGFLKLARTWSQAAMKAEAGVVPSPLTRNSGSEEPRLE
jgi:hypothetical protein